MTPLCMRDAHSIRSEEEWRTALTEFIDSVSEITSQDAPEKATLDPDQVIAVEAELESLRSKVDELTEEVRHRL
jgi:hypothetical protein